MKERKFCSICGTVNDIDNPVGWCIIVGDWICRECCEECRAFDKRGEDCLIEVDFEEELEADFEEEDEL